MRDMLNLCLAPQSVLISTPQLVVYDMIHDQMINSLSPVQIIILSLQRNRRFYLVPQRTVFFSIVVLYTCIHVPMYAQLMKRQKANSLENITWSELGKQIIHSSRDSVRKARESHLIDKAMTLEPHGLNRRDELL